ncbi:DegV family protein [Streptococcus didelphis]|uniref:DegV family protein n=1 Tax=Streptococcus didelphis TaxID=102886 RepID=A0ABY9LGC7_9STRE|nr:DegV family protein [Streptococcus didelphis]WMB27922.1 DegV family protein [Streptococcus didelphis]
MFSIVTDSTSDLCEGWAQDYDIEILGLSIECNGTVYQTVGPNKIKSQELLEKMKNGSHPKTSQINVGEFEEVFRTYAERGRDLLYLAFSSVLSGTYQSAVIARDLVLEEFPQAVIEIVDTLAAAGGEGYLSILAAQAKDQGKSLMETKKIILDILPRLRTYFLVDDLFHLMRGGRLSKSAAILGKIASIKPILSIDSKGSLVPVAKVRGRKKALKEIVSMVESDIAHSTIIISYTDTVENTEKAEMLRDYFLENDKVTDTLLLPLGPVLSAHVGPDTLAAFVIGQEPRK